MKILHIHWRYDTFGGGEKYLFDLCNAQEEAGHSVSVLSSLSSNIDPIAQNKNVYLIDNSFGIRSGYRILNQVVQIVQNIDPDIIHLHETLGFLSPLILNRLLRQKPVVQTLHTAFSFCPISTKILPDNMICTYRMSSSCLLKGCFKKIDLRLYSNMLWRVRVLKKVDRVIVPSKYLKEEAIRNGISADNIQTIPLFTEKNPKNEYTEPENNSILFVGRADPLKGLSEFINALHLIKDQPWKAYIIGGLDSSGYHKKTANKLGISSKIHFLDNISHTGLDEYYKKASIVVFPSMSPESFGLVGIEGMSFGRPVIAYDVGGPREWLADTKTGFLIKRGDTVNLASSIKKLLEDNNLCRQMGYNAMESVARNFRKDSHIHKLLFEYETAIKKWEHK